MRQGDLFELSLTQEDDRQRALASWRGQRARGDLEAGLEGFRERLRSGSTGRGASDATSPQRLVVRASRPPELRSVRQIGESLFAFLPEPVRRLWATARERCAAEGRRLHLELRVDPGLEDLPWELLREPDGGVFLAASDDTSMFRCVEPTRPEPLRRPSSSPARLLIFAASPPDLDPLDVEAEISRIRQTLAGTSVEIEVVPGGDRDSLLESLRSHPPDVVHWISHGVGDFDHGGRLLVESRVGGSESVRPDQLVEMLGRVPSLVVLATCDSARSGNGDSLAALAPMLVRAGVPAVVAMRDAIRDEDAIRFTQALYSSLGQGVDVAGAVATARRSLLLHEAGDRGDWAIPVLYQSGISTGLAPWQLVNSTRRAGSATRLLATAVAPVALAAVAIWWIGRPAEVAAPQNPPEQVPMPSRSHDPRCPSVPGVDAPMVVVGAGSFDMGSTTGKTDERPVHRVSLRDPFCLGRFEVTVAQWNAVMPDDLRHADGVLPATSVSFDDATRFLAELNRRAPGRPFRLPTEAEWEFAARAGTDTTWSFGDRAEDLPVHGNCSPSEGNDGFDRTAPVGSLLPNPWGLYDMHGNVAEWTADRYGAYSSDAVTDPRGAEDAETRVRRGGNYLTREENCSSSRRYSSKPDTRIPSTGFRLAADLP